MTTLRAALKTLTLSLSLEYKIRLFMCETVPQACLPCHRWPSDSLLCDVMSFPPFVTLLKRTFLKMSFCLKLLNSSPSSFAWQQCVCLYINNVLYSCSQKQELLRCRWGCWRAAAFLFGLYLYTGFCFIIHSRFECWGPACHHTLLFQSDEHNFKHHVPPALWDLPLYKVTSGRDHCTVLGHKVSPGTF